MRWPILASLAERGTPRLRGPLLALLTLGCLAVAAPLIAPHDPLAQPDAVALRYSPPSPVYPMGTDAYSRDVFSRVLHGMRISFGIATLATALAMTVGIAYGLTAGYVGGWLDSLMMRLLDGLMAIPRILLVLALLGAAGSLPVAALVAVLGLTGWFHVARLVRAEALTVKELEYVTAARALGGSSWRIATRHILPNIITPAIVASTLGFAHVVALEAGLSYLGVGVRAPAPSWGSMIQEGTEHLGTAWWVAFFPGVALVATVLCANALGDRLRASFGGREIPRA